MWCVGLFVMWCGAAEAPVVHSYCQIAKPIRMSHSDSRGTKEQIARENLKIKRICPK